MIKYFHAWVVLTLLLCASAGCGSLFTQSFDSIPEWTEAEWEEVSTKLAGDQWQQKPEWTFWKMAETMHEELAAEQGIHWRHPAETFVRDAFEKNSWDHKDLHPATPPANSKDTSPAADGKPPAVDLKSEPPAETSTASLSASRRELIRALAQEDNLSGWNAAITIGLLRPQEGSALLPILWPLVDEPREYELPVLGPTTKAPPASKTTPKLRAAAAEACGRILALNSETTTPENIEKLRTLLTKDNLPDVIHVELLLAAGKCLPPREIPGLARLFGFEKRASEKDKPTPKIIRRAALEACLLHALRKRQLTHADPALIATSIAEDWPLNLTNLEHDTDPGIRSDLGRLLAIARHPKAWLILRDQGRDLDAGVRQEAIISLGWLGTEQAREELRKQRMSEHEMIRVAAVKGLAHWGPEELRPFLNPQEKSPAVRQEVARQLGQFHEDRAAELLRLCLTDINPQVQQEAIRQAEKLPERLAVPLLITALNESSASTRQNALAELENRAGKPLVFPIYGTSDERQRETLTLRQLWPQRGGGQEILATPSARDSERHSELRVVEMKAELQTYLDLSPGDPRVEASRERLRQLTVADVRWIEDMVPRCTPEQNERLAHEVLPSVSPVYQALHDLQRQEIQTRRQAAEHLYQEGTKATISRMAVLRLHQILMPEQDAMVWRFCMLALAQDGSPEAMQIAQLAVNNSWPDIRVLGCDYIARHGTAEQAHWIRGLFADKNTNVQTAAIRAAIHCRNPVVLADTADGQPGLKRILTSANSDVRVQVACCLCLFGDDQGYQELMRLSQSGDWMVRIQVVRGMAESGQTRFVSSLINLGWTEKHPSVRMAIMQGLEKLVPETQRPSGLAATGTPDQKLALWAAWWEKSRQRTADTTSQPIVEAGP